MAQRINVKVVTVPANTQQAAPLTTTFTIRPGTVERIEVLVPPGPSGFLGFQVLFAGVLVIPDDIGVFIVTDNELISWPLGEYPTDGRWSVRAYNTDVFDHSIHVRLLVNELRAPVQLFAPTVPIG
jgi:hypothetical protein